MYIFDNKEVGENWPLSFHKLPAMPLEERISLLQRRCIIYAIQYYDYDESCVSDKYNDAVGYQLVWYMNNYPIDILEKSRYWYCMHDYDATTGHHLMGRLTEGDREYLYSLAVAILEQWRRSR